MKVKKDLNFIFVVILLLVLVLGLGRTLIFPKEINEYENRYANKVKEFSLASYFDSSFQNSVEDALGDQVLGAEDAKRAYNESLSKYINSVLENVFGFSLKGERRDYSLEELSKNNWKTLMENPEGKYVSDVIKIDDNLILANGHLCYVVDKKDWSTVDYENNVLGINEVIKENPNLDFYAYYIQRELDMDFETGDKSGLNSYVLNTLDIEDGHKGYFDVDGFATFDKYFYTTDHHWNYLGSYKAYRQLGNILGFDEYIEPVGIVDIGHFSGSRAAQAGSTEYDEINRVFEFNFNGYTYTINGKEAEDYGSVGEYISNAKKTDVSDVVIDYEVYGGDQGEVVLSNPKSNGGNLLVIGDSFDNAILKLLAHNFSGIYSVDLRYYQTYMGREFNLADYTRENGIDKVLIIGRERFWCEDDFLLNR